MEYLSPAQCRAARALLNWSQPDLAKRCDMHVQTISAFESENSTPTKRTLTNITDTLEQAGIEFSVNQGVSLRADPVIVFKGQDGFKSFMTDVYETCKSVGGNVYVGNADEELFDYWMGEEFEAVYAKNMRAIPKDHFWFHIIVCEGSQYLPVPHGEYRWVPKEFFSPNPVYIYGHKLGLISFMKNDVTVHVYQQKELVNSQITQFLWGWKHANKFINPPPTK